MAQVRQQKSAAWARYAQPAVVQQTSGVSPRVACEQLEQMARKLNNAHAEINRYQTRLFACEREMIALRKENAALEAACEQLREEAAQAAAEAEKLREELNGSAQSEAPAEEPAPEDCPAEAVPETQPDAPVEAAPEAMSEPSAEPAPAAEPEAPAPVQQAEPQPPAEPEWQPKTELEHLSVELMNWFDQMMGA